MFNFSLKAKTLGQLLNLAGCIRDDINLTISNNGLKIVSRDPANIAICVIDLKPEEFSRFDVSFPSHSDPEAFWSIYVYIPLLLNILKRFDSTEICTIRSVQFQSGRKTYFEIGGRSFSINEQDERTQYVRIPNFNLPFTVSVPLLELSRDMTLVSEYSEAVYVTYARRHDHDEIWLTDEKAPGEKFRSAYKGDIEALYLDMEMDWSTKTISSVFSLDYFRDIVYAMKYRREWICKTVKLNFGQDRPIIISGQPSENLSFRFFIAPRLEDD